MRILASPARLTAALFLLVPVIAVTWILAVPEALSPLNYLIFAALLTALTAIALITYGNAQATGSMAQVLHEADGAARRAAHGIPGVAPGALPRV